MKTKSILLTIAAIALSSSAFAITTQSVGSGSAVSSVDRAAYFEDLPSSGTGITHLEDGLSVYNPGRHYDGWNYPYAPKATVTDGYFYHNHNTYSTITTGDAALMSGLEVLLGHGVSRIDLKLYWETFKAGSLVSSGRFNGEVMTVLGLADTSGFDELRIAGSGGIGDHDFGDYSYLTFDNLEVQLLDSGSSNGGNTSGVPDTGSTAALLGSAILGLAMLRRRSN